jgi:hypothetical protein
LSTNSKCPRDGSPAAVDRLKRSQHGVISCHADKVSAACRAGQAIFWKDGLDAPGKAWLPAPQINAPPTGADLEADMPTDIPPPADNAHLFADPAVLARDADRIAQQAFDAGDGVWAEVWQGIARRYRDMAARGERVPNF